MQHIDPPPFFVLPKPTGLKSKIVYSQLIQLVSRILSSLGLTLDDKYSIIDSQQRGTDMLPEWLTPGTFLIGLVLLAGVCWLADKLGWWK